MRRVEYNSPQMRIAANTSLNPLGCVSCPRLARQLKSFISTAGALFLLAALSAQAHATARQLTIYTIDVEGGQSTLIVSPDGGTMLVDTGWPGNDERDAKRIQEAMKDAGVTKLDYVLITHFHMDHVGGVPNLVEHVKVGEFIDHGVDREDSADTRGIYEAYLKVVAHNKRHIAHPGDTIDLPGLSTVVLTADGEHIKSVPGVTPQPNPYCASEPKWELDSTENPRSTGVLIRYGKFRFLDLGDLTKAKEIPLVCPVNLIGHVDLYLVNHHGFNLSNTKAFVDAIHPRVAIMDNGSHKAGSPEAYETVHASPGLEDLYMLHINETSDAAHNSPAPLVANLKGGTDGNYFKVVAHADGSFSVFNSRTGKTKEYPAQ